MTFQEALKVLEDFVLAQGYSPVVVFEALDVLEELVREVADEEPLGYGLEIGQ